MMLRKLLTTNKIRESAICLLCIIMFCTGCASGAASGGETASGALSQVDRLLIEDKVSEIVSRCPGEVGVAVIVNNVDTITVNDRKIYPMMSVFKVHQALAVCKDLDDRGTSLDSVVTLSRGELDPETWSPMLREHPEPEIRLRVSDLLRYTITQSDNNASNYMFSRLTGVGQTDSFVATVIPRESFRIAYSEAEMSAAHDRAYVNATSPLGAAALMNGIFTDSLLSHDKQTFIIDALKECKTGKNRIAAPLQDKPGVTIAHKTGSGYTTGEGVLVAHNDVAYVGLPNGVSFTLAVFVKDFKGDEAGAAKVIADISSSVYSVLSRVER